MTDWEQYRYKTVLCEFRPRPFYCGRPMRRSLGKHVGRQIELQTQWRMEEDDQYPGEYALSTPRSAADLTEILGVPWVASGDVVVVETKEPQT